jgi:DNA-binding transcriptional MerR regulator
MCPIRKILSETEVEKMPTTLPGTAIAFNGRETDDTYSLIAPIIDATGGISLSQLSAMTGLEGSTVQNWIKRGWVVPSVGKKYGERSVVRILLINILRSALKLEDIARLMRYVNGEVADTSDDIMHDTQLYNLLCSLIYEVENKRLYREDEILAAIDGKISTEIEGRERDVLRDVLLIMVQSAMAGYYGAEAQKQFSKLDISGENSGKVNGKGK